MIGWLGIAATFDFLTVLLIAEFTKHDKLYLLPLYLLNSISENCCTFCFWFPAEALGIYIALISDFTLFFLFFFRQSSQTSSKTIFFLDFIFLIIILDFILNTIVHPVILFSRHHAGINSIFLGSIPAFQPGIRDCSPPPMSTWTSPLPPTS